MIERNNTIIRLFTSVILALVVVMISGITILLITKKIDHISKTTEEKKKLNFILKNQDQIISKIKNDFASVDNNYDNRIITALPSANNILPFVDALDSIAKKNSFEQSLVFSKPEAESTSINNMPLLKINFGITLNNANNKTLENYLKDFENLPYFMNINSINLISKEAAGWQNNSTINISGQFYARK